MQSPVPRIPVIRTNYLFLLIVVACILLIGLDRLTSAPLLRSLTGSLWLWMVVLGACALLLGVGNVLILHCRRVLAGGRSWAYSLVLVATALAVFVLGLLGPGGSRNPLAEWVFAHILTPGMGTLFALLAFFTLAAGFRYLRVGGAEGDSPSSTAQTPSEGVPQQSGSYQGGGWMLSGALLFLLLQLPMFNAAAPAGLLGFAGWLLDVPIMATLRGALLGGSVALIVVGARLVVTGK